MAKTSDWKIVATEGATVDKRTITATWIKDMAETYSHDLTTALIWPEHYKGDTPWGPYEGKNWGIVEELKAEKRAGKYRLLAKITPNSYSLLLSLIQITAAQAVVTCAAWVLPTNQPVQAALALNSLINQGVK